MKKCRCWYSLFSNFKRLKERKGSILNKAPEGRSGLTMRLKKATACNVQSERMSEHAHNKAFHWSTSYLVFYWFEIFDRLVKQTNP